LILALILSLVIAARAQEIFELLRKGDIAAAKALIEKTPQLVEARDGQGMTLLHYAAFGRDAGFIDFLLVDLLLEKGARLPEPGEKWHGLIHMAASRGLDTLFRRLAGQVRDLKAAAGEGLLRAAAEGGSAGIVALLLGQGYDAATADRFG
jgi:ankyrin repeat protein